MTKVLIPTLQCCFTGTRTNGDEHSEHPIIGKLLTVAEALRISMEMLRQGARMTRNEDGIVFVFDNPPKDLAVPCVDAKFRPYAKIRCDIFHIGTLEAMQSLRDLVIEISQ